MYRYENTPTSVAVIDGQPVEIVMARFKYRPPTSFQTYVVRTGDRWDLLADRIYGTSEDWWRIADLNPELHDPRAMRPGMVIRIP